MKIPGKNTLLIADPFLKDTHFQRSVVLLCSHQDDGSMGFILNRSFHLGLNQLMTGVDGLHIPVYVGGPVGMDSLHFIHQYPHLIPHAELINEHLAWGGDFDTVKQLLLNQEIDTKCIRFFIGYSGWSAGQLEEEMKEKTWLVGDTSHRIIFETDVDQIWKESVKTLGEPYHEMVHYPIDPQLN